MPSADAPSRYLKSKAAAEAMVAASGIEVDDLPAVGDLRPRGQFPQHVRAAGTRRSRRGPLAAPSARFQPVYVGDVAHCFVRAINDEITFGGRYDLCGPKVYTLQQLVTYVGEISGRRAAASSRWARGCRAVMATRARASAGQDPEPRQPGVDAQGQRLRLSFPCGVRHHADGARIGGALVPLACRAAQPVRPLSRRERALIPTA